LNLNKLTYFYPEKPTLITLDQPLFQTVSDDPNWVAEFKYNGSRCELHNINGKFEFWDRHGKKLVFSPDENMLTALNSTKFPSGYNLFDGELRHNKVIGVRNMLVLYDVHIWNGEVLINKSFEYRRALLESVLSIGTKPLSITQQFNTDFDATYKLAVLNDELEGLVMKNLKGNLDISRTSNRTSTWMLKVRKKTGRHKF